MRKAAISKAAASQGWALGMGEKGWARPRARSRIESGPAGPRAAGSSRAAMRALAWRLDSGGSTAQGGMPDSSK